MIISARRTLCSVLREKFLGELSRQYHGPMKITFADNQQKFDSRTTSTLYTLPVKKKKRTVKSDQFLSRDQ